MINNYYNYLRNFLTIIATFFVFGNAGAQEPYDLEFNIASDGLDKFNGTNGTPDYRGKLCNIKIIDLIPITEDSNDHKFKENEWTGVCFPFDISTAILNSTFGENNYEIQQLQKIDEDGKTFVFKKTTSIEAGKPYFMKIKTTVPSPLVFSGVTISASISNDFFRDANSSESLAFRGFYFPKFMTDMFGQNQAHNLYEITASGSLNSPKDNWKTNNHGGISAYIFIENSSVVPSIRLEGSSSGEGSGEGGEGGGGDDPVDTSTLEYKIAHKLQLTDAPTVYITLPDIGNETLDSYLYKTGGNATTAAEAPYRKASIKVVATDDTTSPHYMESFEEDADHLEIKVRGNSTSLQGVTNAKRPYRLKFAKKDKTTGQNFKHDMTNAGYSKRNWVLLANAFDHSLIRNALTCELGKIVGMPFNPGYKFVDLVINGDYRGTYQISDHPEVDGDRINVNEDTGWYVEFQGRGDMCDYPMCFAEGGYIMNIKNPEPADETDETERNTIINNVKDWFINTWGPSFNAGFTSPTTGWRAYNDEETLLKWWIITEITGDYDGMMTAKAYRESNGKLYWGPIWDKDLAYGNYSSMSEADGTLVLNLSGNGSSIQGKFQQALAKDPKFMAAVKAKMDALVSSGLKATLCSKIDNLAAIVAQTEALNKDKWGYTKVQGGLEVYHGGVEGYKDYSAYIAQLKNWINARVDYVQTQINTLYTAANPAQPEKWTYNVRETAGSSSIPVNVVRDVTMTNRALIANEWNAVSFPFDIDEEMMTSIFGSSYQLKTFTGVSNDGTKMIFETPADNTITAGMPYLLKPSVAVDASPLFSSVIPSCTIGYYNNSLQNGSVITYGNYSFGAQIMAVAHPIDGTIKLVASNGSGLSVPTKDSEYSTTGTVSGCMAYIKILNSAADPIIQFGKDEPVVRTQKSDVPTIYIDTQDNKVIQPSTGDFVPAAIQVFDKNNLIDGNFTETSDHMEIRGRNKTEWSDNTITKKSYRLKFAKDEKDGAGNVTTSHKHDLTGGGYAKRNWILVANAADESMVRNALADELSKAMGFEFTPNYQFVDLYINNEYKGTYMATDHVEADKEGDVTKRVPVDEKQGWLLDMVTADGIATGDIYVAGSDSYPYINIKNPEPGKKTGTDEEIKTKVKTFFDTLWEANNGTGLDKASFVNWYIATEVLGNASALTGFYAYKENDAESLKFGPLWGNELAFGNSSSTINMSDLNTTNSYNGMVYQSGTASAWKTKLQALWQQGWFKQAVKDRWAELYKNGTNDLKSTMLTKFIDVNDAINKADEKPTEEQLNVISTYLEERFEYLNTKFAELTVINGPVVTVGAGGYGSFSWPQALDFSGTDIEVYIATNRHDNSMQLKQLTDGKVPANEGIIVKGTTGTTVFPETTDGDVTLPATNLLSGTATNTYTSQGDIYALSTIDGITGFYKVKSGVTVPLHKAYYKPTSNSPEAIFLDFDDLDTTGINRITAGNDNDGEVYDLQGRRMKGNLAKGIYIKNGKKFIVK